MTASRPADTGLFRDPDFRRLWTADAVSQAGTAVTLLALPLVALGTLHADAFQAGLLVAFEYLGFLLLGLPAGALVDRTSGHRVMIAGDLGRAALLGSVPVAAWLDVLSLTQLYAVAFGLSVCTVFFDVAAQSRLPRLVAPDRLVEANVRIEAGRTLTQAAGPGAGGALVGVLTAPVALVLDAVSYLASAALLARIRRPDAVPGGDGVPGAGVPEGAVRGAARDLRADIAEGLRFVLGNRLLRALTLGSALSNLFGTMGAAMLLVLLAGELGLSPFLCGLVFTAEAAGGFLGSLLTTRITRRLGRGPAMCAAVVTSGVLWLAAVPCFQADWRLALAVALQGLGWTAFMTFKITSVSLRQELCPEPMLGRMTATFRFVVWGVMPVGALAGGVLGQHLGARPALWIGALGELAAVLPLLLSPLRRLRELPRSVPSAGERPACRSPQG
ncbi:MULTISPECIES: MFS transporter [unclassified Streptomyces]|uniref:MFS transporter n=1 Tax=unclassified Streptomyces TaxID=2593676 RepID=UPI00202E896F|nr:MULTISPECIES: MFS transporter [unclassified Streptomyces]MCM1965735.1 MFS transporter [Streptomyces sp. G1]MCX5123829.1 MFS transporter [Streptomyces sp. NBC_00347]